MIKIEQFEIVGYTGVPGYLLITKTVQSEGFTWAKINLKWAGSCWRFSLFARIKNKNYASR